MKEEEVYYYSGIYSLFYTNVRLFNNVLVIIYGFQCQDGMGSMIADEIYEHVYHKIPSF
jgi:hypothetical protein